MRPKKIVLCVNDNESELSVLCFLLVTNGFRPVPATSGREAIGIFSETAVDMVISDFSMPEMNGDALVLSLKQIVPYIPMVILGDPGTIGDRLHAADAVLNKKSVSSEEILSRVKLMCSRKRGPRKGTPRPPRKEPGIVTAEACVA
ncbi:response regulator [Acidobacteria bacterium AB60]|nr:response regulator [Acidobacteria bacterium AB60]